MKRPTRGRSNSASASAPASSSTPSPAPGSFPTAGSSSSSKPKPTPSLRSTKTSRMSIKLPVNVKLPSLPLSLVRRHDSSSADPSAPPVNTKTPLLTLTFSSRSFLDSSVFDADARAHAHSNTGRDRTGDKDKEKQPLYTFKTVGTSTTISRREKENEATFHKMASIKWPRSLPMKTGRDYTDGVLIQMKNARWYGGETLLKLGSGLNASRKFSIPNYSHAMKWKRYGNTYWCTTASVKGPIATLDTTKGPEPLKLTIYETLHDKYDPGALTAFKGVSILLLDYLLVTGMLLVTDLQEWMLVRKADGEAGVDGQGGLRLTTGVGTGQGLGLASPSSVGQDVPFRSDPRFRKIMYGEPIFSKVAGEDRDRGGRGSREEERRRDKDRSRSPPVPHVIDITAPQQQQQQRQRQRQRPPQRQIPQTPTTPESGMPTFLYPESEISSPGPSTRITTLPSMTDSEDEYDDDDEDEDYEVDEFDTFSLPDPHRASALADSIHFSASSGAPTHTSIDPHYYEIRPPVPPLPLKYAKSFSNINTVRQFNSQPSTPVSGSFPASSSSCEPPVSGSISINNMNPPPIPALPSHLPPYLQSVDPISRPRSSPPLQSHSRSHSHSHTTSPPLSPRTDSLGHGHGQMMSSGSSTRSARNYSEPHTHTPSMMGVGRTESVRSYGSGSASGSGVPSTSTATTKRPLPRPPPLPSANANSNVGVTVTPPTARRVQSSSQLAHYPTMNANPSTSTSTTTPTPAPRSQRSLPPTPSLDAALNTSPSPSSSATNYIPSPPPALSPIDPSLPHPYPYPYPYPPPNTYPYPYPYPPYAYAAYPYPAATPFMTAVPAHVHARQPPITKASQEDLASYVHMLTTAAAAGSAAGGAGGVAGGAQRDGDGEGQSQSQREEGSQTQRDGEGERQLPVEPLPSSSIYDVPPPAYNTIVFGGPLPPSHSSLPPSHLQAPPQPVRSMPMPDTSGIGIGHDAGAGERERRPTAPELSLMGLGRAQVLQQGVVWGEGV